MSVSKENQKQPLVEQINSNMSLIILRAVSRIITVRNNGTDFGITASAVSSVSVEPPDGVHRLSPKIAW
jgi:flavin reductase (DIM6/NTAB) family NADH-FMN oxidoreductase RutF